MRNKLLAALVGIVLILGIAFVVSSNKETDTLTETGELRDQFGLDYDIDNEYFIVSNPSEVKEKLSNDETFVVFVGRKT
jgi:hypothetical protein